MNENKGLRIWQIAVLLLVLCNIGIIVTIWLKPHPDGPPPHGESPRDYVIRNLKFTDAQAKSYDVLIKDHQQAMRQLRHQGGEYRQALFAHLKDEYQNNSFTDSLTLLIATNQKEIEIVTYNHFVHVKALCDDAQKKEFDNIIGDVMKKMGGDPPPGDRHGPPPPGPRDADHHPHDDGVPPPPPPPEDGR